MQYYMAARLRDGAVLGALEDSKLLGIHQREVQWDGRAVDGGSIISYTST